MDAIASISKIYVDFHWHRLKSQRPVQAVSTKQTSEKTATTSEDKQVLGIHPLAFLNPPSGDETRVKEQVWRRGWDKGYVLLLT